MFALMFGVGVSLTVADFRRVARNPRATVVGTVLQLMVMPLAGILVGRYFGLPPLLAAGLVVIAACPGGMFSNMFVHIARGHTALSITLTATATLVTLFTLPLWVRFGVQLMPGAQLPEMPVLDTAFQLGLLTVLPVGLGMLSRMRWGEIIRWERRLTLVSAGVIVVGMTIQAASRPDLSPDDLTRSLAPAVTLAATGFVLGVGVPVLCRLGARDAVTVAVELVVKNALLGLVLVNQTLDFEAAIPVLTFSIFQTPLALVLLFGWRFLARRGYVEALPPPVEVAAAGKP